MTDGNPQSPFWPAGLDFHLPVVPGNAFANLLNAARRDPGHPALL